MFAVIEKAKVLHLPDYIVCELFNVCVVPVLLYGSEIWGFENLRDVEVFHRGFMRLILKVFKFTSNAMLYGELGATDMSTIIYKRMINFWLKLKFSPLNKFSSIMCRLMSKLHIDYPDSYNFKWCRSIQSSLDTKGFSEVWNVSCINIDYFKEIFAQRCDDISYRIGILDSMKIVSAQITAVLNKVYKLKTTWYSWMMMQNILFLSLELVHSIFQ